MDPLARVVKSVLSPDLCDKDSNFPLHHWPDERPYRGLCYVASEAYYHLAGGKAAGLTPMRGSEPKHWWLRGEDGIIDLTAEQFAEPYDYTQGKGCGFQTKQPSKRAQEIIRRCERWVEYTRSKQ